MTLYREFNDIRALCRDWRSWPRKVQRKPEIVAS